MAAQAGAVVTATLAEKRHEWVSTGRSRNYPDKLCVTCGASFFTNVGLSEHERIGCGNGHGSPVKRRRTRPTPAQVAAWSAAGRHVTALNNARRIRCGGCEKVSTPSGIAAHQRSTGHTGRIELS